MSCYIPGCNNRQVQWTTPLPRDELLLARWNAAIRAGTGRSLVEAQICDAHFVNVPPSSRAQANQTGYQEPTLFCRNNTQLQVTWCRLCLRHDSVDSMFDVNERPLSGSQSLSWMANKHFGVWLYPEQPSKRQYFCKQCKVRLESTHAFWQEIQDAAEQYQRLCQKMSTQRLTFQKFELSNQTTVQGLDRSKVEDAASHKKLQVVIPQSLEFPAITDDELDGGSPPAKKLDNSNVENAATQDKSHFVNPQLHEFPAITEDELEDEAPPAKKLNLSKVDDAAAQGQSHFVKPQLHEFPAITEDELEDEAPPAKKLDRSKVDDAAAQGKSQLDNPPLHDFPAITEDELEDEAAPAKKRMLSNDSQSSVKMFAVVEFIRSPTPKVVAIPTAWLKNDLLMWPKLVNGETIDKMRQEGLIMDDSVDSEDIPVIVLQKFEQFQSAEAAAQAVSRRRNPQPTPSGPSINSMPVVAKETLTYKAFRNEIHGLKRDLNTLVQTAVEAAAERSFRTNLNRFSSVFGVQSTIASNSTPPDQPRSAEAETGAAEKHKKISNEYELDEWNTQLADESLCYKYLEYFAKIIIPNSCTGKGDNALYTIVDYLFTRDFWNHFTWTGISRGQKSNRGFREFGNVTNLMLNVVRLGDSTYDAPKLEAFCRTRLFRYCKARSARQQIRRSSCRPRRKHAAEARRLEELGRSLTDDGSAQPSMICKVEVDSDELWRQSEDTNPDQNSDSMM